MPEGLEMGTNEDIGTTFVLTAKPEQLHVQAVYTDATSKEEPGLPERHPGREGHVFEILSSEANKFRRFGGREEKDSDDQMDPDPHPKLPSTPYPPQYATSKGNIPLESRGLVIKKFHESHRNVIIEFCDAKGQELWLQVQTLTHTSLNITERERWFNSVAKVPKRWRGHKVVLALILKDHVLSFNSLDMVAKVFWSETRSGLPDQLPVLSHQVKEWLEDVALFIPYRRAQVEYDLNPKNLAKKQLKIWIPLKERPRWVKMGNRVKAAGLAASHRNAPAIWVVRKSGVFPGVGVYSASEVFNLAGLFINLTESAVFNSPSRTAMLCAAVLSFMVGNRDRLWSLVRSKMVDHTLAVSIQDRLDFSNQILNVWARNRTYTNSRHKALILSLGKVRSSDVLYTSDELSSFGPIRRKRLKESLRLVDPVEPNGIRFALEQEKFNLGALIFGEYLWDSLSRSAGLPDGCRDNENPLAAYFKEELNKEYGWKPKLNASRPCFEVLERYLDISVYEQLFTPKDDTKSKYLTTHAYRETWLPKSERNPGSDIWTIYPLRKLCEAWDQTRKILEEHDPTIRNSRLSVTIIKKSLGWTIGAFDFCGLAIRLSSASDTPVIAYCLEDPTISLFYQRRLHYERALRPLSREQRKKGLAKVVEAIRAKSASKTLTPEQKELTSGEKKALEVQEKIRTVLSRIQTDPVGSTVPPSQPADQASEVAVSDEPPAKKRRIRADKALVLASISQNAGGGTSSAPPKPDGTSGLSAPMTTRSSRSKT